MHAYQHRMPSASKETKSVSESVGLSGNLMVDHIFKLTDLVSSLCQRGVSRRARVQTHSTHLMANAKKTS